MQTETPAAPNTGQAITWQPVSYDVLISAPVDGFGDRGTRAYIDGRRVPLAEVREISASPYVELSCFSTTKSRDGKRWLFRKVATI